MAGYEDAARWSDVETIDRTVEALQKAGDDLSSVLLLLRALEARGLSNADGVLGPLQALISSLDEIEPFVARHGGAVRPRAATAVPTLLERLAAFGMPASVVPVADPFVEQLSQAGSEGFPASTAGRPDGFIAAARRAAAVRRAEDELGSEEEQQTALRASMRAAKRAAEGQYTELGRLPALGSWRSSFIPPPHPSGLPASVTAAPEAFASLDPVSNPPAPLATGLRNVVAFALGGAVIAGMLLGHQLAGVDPRYGGAAVGAVAGLLVWAVRGF